MPAWSLQINQWLWKESFTLFVTVNKGLVPCGCLQEGWRLYLLMESVLSVIFRRAVEAELLRPGILASHSSSSGRRTARSWREPWQQRGWAQWRLPAPANLLVEDLAVSSIPSEQYPASHFSHPCWLSDAGEARPDAKVTSAELALLWMCESVTVSTSLKGEPNSVVHKAVPTMFHRLLLVFTLPLLFLLFLKLVCGAGLLLSGSSSN